MLSDLTYTAKSEHFIDIYYPKTSKPNEPTSFDLDNKNNKEPTQVTSINGKKGESAQE